MTHKDEKDLRTTVSIPVSIEEDLMRIVDNVRKRLPPELSRKVSPPFVITMIVRDWINRYKNKKASIEDLIEPSRGQKTNEP